MTGDCHARICGSREVRLLPATRPLSLIHIWASAVLARCVVFMWCVVEMAAQWEHHGEAADLNGPSGMPVVSHHDTESQSALDGEVAEFEQDRQPWRSHELQLGQIDRQQGRIGDQAVVNRGSQLRRGEVIQLAPHRHDGGIADPAGLDDQIHAGLPGPATTTRHDPAP